MEIGGKDKEERKWINTERRRRRKEVNGREGEGRQMEGWREVG